MLALHYRLERFDYLDFLPKRPQGTTKILGTSAFAGTKMPTALKSHKPLIAFFEKYSTINIINAKETAVL